MELKKYLDTKQIKYEDAAQQIGVDQSTITHWINGRSIPRRTYMRRIHEWSSGQVTANDFYGIAGNAPDNPAQSINA